MRGRAGRVPLQKAAANVSERKNSVTTFLSDALHVGNEFCSVSSGGGRLAFFEDSRAGYAWPRWTLSGADSSGQWLPNAPVVGKNFFIESYF